MDLDNPSYFSVPNTTSNGARKKEFLSRKNRTFFRSFSSNSDSSNHDLILMGEPRLSDIAPEFANNRRNSKQNEVDCNTEIMSGDEVFLEDNNTARYYNTSAFKNVKIRRHSIGTFSRERSSSVASSNKSFKEDFHQNMVEETNEISCIDEHSLRHNSYPRKRCLQCSKGTLSRTTNMDDIIILSLKASDAASLWVDYFSNYFHQISKQANRKPFNIKYIGAEDIINIGDIDKEKELINKSSGVKLQIVVLCPSLLEFILEHPQSSEILGKILLSDRTLALLLGVCDSDLNDIHKKVLPSYFQWQRQSVGQDQDEHFTKEFLAQAMGILSKIWKQQSSVISQEKSCFSVTPKKIRQGQNSVFIILTYPLQKDDVIKISIEKNGELNDIKNIKKRNPYILKITVPENLTEVTAIVNILVEKNGNIIGSRPIKCESRLRELEQILKSANHPVDFMCQALGFSPGDREHLDNWLLQGFKKNFPPNFNLLSNHTTPFSATVQLHRHSHEEFPTLLHFAAKFGLSKLAVQLLDCPGADIAYEIRNIYDMTPLEIAQNNGFSELASMLRGYMNMNEVTSVYAKLKEMSLNAKQSELNEDGYLSPKSIQEFYKMCPPPRPVTNVNNDICGMTSVNSTPVTTPVSDCLTPSGYTPMNSPSRVMSKEDILDLTSSSVMKIEHKVQIHNENSHLKNFNKNSNIQKNLVSEIEDKVQKELVEIIMDFKNNVHSISQVETLVEEWKNRNDVQKSFKEKQEQLLEMRMRYEKIQQEMKTALKKPTPFERIKKLFSRHKTDKSDVSQPMLTVQNGAQNQTRPISSLSTASTGSSGRMSTISGSSLGDSGTHSDNDERKVMLSTSHTEDDFRNELNKAILELNYTPVPVPKPVKMFNGKTTFETIEEKPVRPDNLQMNDEFYIHFPPNGQPVGGLIENNPKKSKNASNLYINVTQDMSPIETHDYMNFMASTSR